MSGSLLLAELLCSRLCHDLSGLVGSLIGVLEIAREEQAASETLAVAEETAVELTQRLKLLRAAWGQDSEPLDLFQLQAFADGLSSSRRLRLDTRRHAAGGGIPACGRPPDPERAAAGGREPAGRRHCRPVGFAGEQCAGDDRRPARGLAGRASAHV